ncbi:MAG: glycosyltransferase [Prevotella sp.]|jgi:GT2 family glycosyltransferase|nr:glycosyltransferase [Prevotella sp.]
MDKQLTNKILVGLISHNRHDFTIQALETLQNTNLPFDLLIIDNGSEKEIKQRLNELALSYGAHFISIENRNCNGARDMINHYGLNYDYVIYVDNDAIMPDKWLESLMYYAEETGCGLLGVSQSEFGNKETFFGNFEVDGSFIIFQEQNHIVTQPERVDWVTGHCLTVKGDFLRLIWTTYRLWERRFMFPIDLDDIDLMMMAEKQNIPVYIAPVVVPQNREFKSSSESNAYNSARNDFHNYALSCVSFWEYWKLNPLLNWNKGYTGNAHKPGKIYDISLKSKFIGLVEMLRDKDKEIYQSFMKKLSDS